jgi:uncharacterized protein YjgD (DUF1641 family)
MKKRKLSDILNEETLLNEGLFVNFLSSVLKVLYSSKTKEIINKIEPANKELAKRMSSLKNASEEVDKMLKDPEVQRMLKNYNIDIKSLPRIKN